MRHLKADVSHRIRRRPSIFGVWWFRLLLAVGLVVIVGLVVGPPVAGWFWSGVTPPPATVVIPPPLAAPRSSALSESVAPAAVASPDGRHVAALGTSDGASFTPADSVLEAPPAAPPVTAPEDTEESSAEPARYRVQVGAFLDHRNADRLVDRLRTQNLEVVDSFIEQSRVLYRVVALPGEQEKVEELVTRLRGLGSDPELLDEGAAVTGFVSLYEAVEAARELRNLGIATRLERQVGAASFRVVRVGEYPTAAEAERLRTELAAQGLEGFVVRE